MRSGRPDPYGAGLITDGRPTLVTVGATGGLPTSGESTPVEMHVVVALIHADLARISRDSALEIKREIPSYMDFPLDCLENAVRRDARRAADTLLGGCAPQPTEISDVSVAAARSEHGVPIDDVLQAYRISLRGVRESFLRHARELEINMADVNQGINLLCETADAVSDQIAKSHRDATIDRTRRDERQRTAFVRGLLFGTIDVAEVRRLAPIYRLSPDRPYYAVRAVPRGTKTLNDLRATLEESGTSTHAPALLCVIDDFLAGVVSKRPALRTDQGIVGIGPMLPLDAAEQSFRAATRNLDTASRLHWGGCFELADLSWRVALVSEHEVGDYLMAKYIAPLERYGKFGELLLSSVREYMVSGRHLGTTARRLHLHVNSLRYRLQRFESIVGVALDQPEVMLEMYWALERTAMGERASDHRDTA
jgi:hypothetical protein